MKGKAVAACWRTTLARATHTKSERERELMIRQRDTDYATLIVREHDARG